MQCHFMAKLFAKVMVMLAHNHLKYKRKRAGIYLPARFFRCLQR